MQLKPKRVKKRITDKAYLDAVAKLGCCLCSSPAEIHHVRTGEGLGQRAADYRAIPLCAKHHRTGGKGTAIHAGRKAWDKAHGGEMYWLEHIWSILEIPESTREQWRSRQYDI